MWFVVVRLWEESSSPQHFVYLPVDVMKSLHVPIGKYAKTGGTALENSSETHPPNKDGEK